MKKEITKKDFKVAYLSMEIAFNNSVKTFCGGLGILAGDIFGALKDEYSLSKP